VDWFTGRLGLELDWMGRIGNGVFGSFGLLLFFVFFLILSLDKKFVVGLEMMFGLG
jgi:hypothetical protein